MTRKRVASGSPFEAENGFSRAPPARLSRSVASSIRAGSSRRRRTRQSNDTASGVSLARSLASIPNATALRRPHRIVAVKSRRTRSVRPPLRGCSAALRPLCGDCAAPMWRFVSMVFAERNRPAGSTSLSKDHGNQEPEPRAGVNVCERSEQPAKAGATLTPSTDQAQWTPKISNLDLRIRKPA
jgi:hypothetical protein